MNNIETMINNASAHIGSFKFKEMSEDIRSAFKEATITRTERECLWNRFQALWDQHKEQLSRRRELSAEARIRYENELYALDFDYDGAPILQSFSNWENVGNKVRVAREAHKAIAAAIKNDRTLHKEDRDYLKNLLNSVWWKIKNSEETTFFVHGERAGELYNEAYRAVDNLPLRESGAIFKANSAELRTLWLSRSDRNKFRSWFDDLWQRLQYKREASANEWRERQDQRLRKLIDARDRMENALDRVRSNISSNRDRLYEARSDSFRERVEGWIQEGEEKERDIVASLDEINEKICKAR